MVQQSKPLRANSFIAEYSPLPGTLRSNTRDVTEEPWTKNTTGRAGSPALGAPIRLRNLHKGMSPFLVQYFVTPDFAAFGRDRRRSLRRHRGRRRHAKAEAFENRASRHPIFGFRHGFIPA